MPLGAGAEGASKDWRAYGWDIVGIAMSMETSGQYVVMLRMGIWLEFS